MDVYSIENKGIKRQSSILRHFATTPWVSFQRLDSMFAHQKRYVFELPQGNIRVRVQDHVGVTKEIISSLQFLERFSDFASRFALKKYSLQFDEILRLIDEWEDDPIGSAGPTVVHPDYISDKQTKEILGLFSPFTKIIQPDHVWSRYHHADIKKIKQRYKTNPIFQNELGKRKARCKAIDTPFSQEERQEVVWLDMTLKLRCWALENGFDGFVYENLKESNGEDNYICLKDNQISNVGSDMFFDEDKYLNEMPRALEAYVMDRAGSSYVEQTGVVWAGLNPIEFWSTVK